MMISDDWTHDFSAGARILDLGCGTGRHARALAEAGFRVTGVDADADAVETARELCADLVHPVRSPVFLAARAESLPFPDASFDAVLCVDMLHWAADAEAFGRVWDEAWRVLGRGGLFRVRALLGEFSADAGRPSAWYLPARAELDARVARAGGTWVETPRADDGANGSGAGRFAIRKS